MYARMALNLKRCSSVATRCCADCSPPFKAPWGEQVQELCGRACEAGCHSEKTSVAKVCFAPGVYSRRHYHPEPTEEVFFVLSGMGEIEVGGATKVIQAGDTVLVPSGTPHQIGNSASSNEILETLVVCVPAWQPTNTVWLDAATAVVDSPDAARAKVDPQPWAPLSARRRAHAVAIATTSGSNPTVRGSTSLRLMVIASAAGLMGYAIGMRLARVR